MNGFDRRKQEKMNYILKAAFELFRNQGFETVKMTDVAEKANVSKVSIYNFFGSKEELLRQVIYDYMDRKAEEFKELMNSNLSFTEKYKLLVDVKLDSMNDLTDGQTDGLLNYNVLASPQVQQFLQTYTETKIKPFYIDFIEQGKREGEIDNDLSTETILMYMQLIGGITTGPLTMKQRLDIGKLFFYGLRGKE
ncbi:MAG: kstR2 [Herbinix sp.]|jgi:AcrR family transcriptional regulator|nr:kstR2 [Herbinix sp.]